MRARLRDTNTVGSSEAHLRSGGEADERRQEFTRRLAPLGRTLVVLARRMTVTAHDAEDLLQSALAAAWERYGSEGPVENFRAWLCRFLVNVGRNQNRRQTRRRGREVSLETAPEEPAVPQDDPPLEALERDLAHEPFRENPAALLEFLDERLSRALVSLEETERVTFLLRAVMDLTVAEIANACSVPRGTAMSRLFRAREKLRALLGVEARDPGSPPPRTPPRRSAP